jgi:hypothetical protein
MRRVKYRLKRRSALTSSADTGSLISLTFVKESDEARGHALGDLKAFLVIFQ